MGFEKWAKQNHTGEKAIKHTESRIKDHEEAIKMEKERLKRLKKTKSP